jgi:wyosine [tRNA(Phe)-imidazoG37] synthetase (radical SAM superfamily)
LSSVVALKERLQLNGLKIAILTNATLLDRPAVREALDILDRSDGEIWAKLDAGTEEYYEKVCVPGGAPFTKILSNIQEASRIRPVVIQSLFLALEGVGPSPEEIDAYCRRLKEIADSGGRIKLVQVYTVARRPAVSSVTPLSNAQVDAIAAEVRRTTGLAAECFYGSSAWQE